MPATNDFLVVRGLNSVARFNFTTGAFISRYLNPTKSTSILNSAAGISSLNRLGGNQKLTRKLVGIRFQRVFSSFIFDEPFTFQFSL